MRKLFETTKKMNPFMFVTYVFLLVIIVKYSNDIGATLNTGIRAFKPLFIGIGIAYVLNIPMLWIEEKLLKKVKKGKRAISILLTYTFALILITVVLSLIIPQLVKTISSLLARSNDYERVYIEVAAFVQTNLGIDVPIDFSGLYDTLGSQIEVIIENLINTLTTFANGSVTFFISVVVSGYLLAGKEQMQLQLKKMLGAICHIKTGNKVLVFLGKVNHIFNSYISGLLVDAVIIGVMIALMMLALGMPYAVLVGVITSVLAIIPIFGAIMAMLIGAVFIFAVSPMQALIFIIAYQIVQQLENNLIYPRVVGASVGLPGLWTMLSVSIAGALYGFVGMLVAVPVTSTIYMILSEFANGRLRKNSITIGDKFSETESVT